MATRYEKARKAALAKVKRLEKQGITHTNIPDFSIVPTTRKERNQYIATAERFTNRAVQKYQYVNTPSGVYTKAEVNQFKRAQSAANRALDRQEKRQGKLEYRMISEEAQGIDPGIKRTVKEDRYNLKSFRYTKRLENFKTREEFLSYVNRLQNFRQIQEDRQAVYKENYIKALENVFGADANQIIEGVRNTSDSEFADLAISTDIGNIDFVYEGAGYFERLEYLSAFFAPDSESTFYEI